MTDQERKAGTMPAVTASTERREVTAMRNFKQARLPFHFDHVLTSFSTQLDVFAVTLKPLITEVLAGYEAAVFAYGQTGTGKTYTMEGDLESSERRGLVPRAAEALIQSLQRGTYLEYSVTASCLEIYNEELSDLLAAPGAPHQKLDLKETGRGVCCTGLSEVPVSSVSEIQELIRRAQERRRVAETRANACSSRSHCLFTLRVCCRRAVSDGEVEAIGKLHLVDLAGSECARKAEERVVGSSHDHQEASALVKGERERRNINQSLLTLGRVIASLRDEVGRVPYRDSKLTRLLQEALGGASRTVMIATISPAQCAVDETISTLQYAEQASGIQNKPAAATLHHFGRNVSPAITPHGEPRAGVSFFSEAGGVAGGAAVADAGVIETLEMRLEYLTQEVEEAQTAFERKQREVQDLHGRAEAAETAKAATLAQLEEAQHHLEQKNFILSRTTDFADAQTAQAKGLALALTTEREQSADLAGKLSKQVEEATAVRGQVRQLCDSAEERAVALVAETQASVRAAVEASEGSCAAHKSRADLMTKAAGEQGERVVELATSVRSRGREMREHLEAAAASAAEAASAEGIAATGRLSAVGAAIESLCADVSQGCSALAGMAKSSEGPLAEQTEALQEESKAGVQGLAEAFRKAASDLSAARAAAKATRGVAGERMEREICAPLAKLQELLRADAASAEQRDAAAREARSGAAAEDAAAAARRGSTVEAAATLAAGRKEVQAAQHAAPLAEALRSLDQAISTGGGAVAWALAAGANQVAGARAELEKAGPRGEGAVLAALNRADTALATAWTTASQELTTLKKDLGKVAFDLRAEGKVATSSGARAERASEALGEANAAEVATLGAVREALQKETAALRQKKEAEQQIVAQLAKQRESLSADVQRLQAQLSSAASKAEDCEASLVAAEAEQRQVRENALREVLKGVEGLLKEQFGDLGRRLTEGIGEARTACGEVAELVTAAGETATTAEQDAVGAGGQAAVAAAGWAAAVDSSCDGLSAAEADVARAAQASSTAKEQAAEQLCDFGSAARGWSIACLCAAEGLDEVLASAGRLATSREAAQPEWTAAREQAAGAASTWLEGSNAAFSFLESAAGHQDEAVQELERLRTQLGQHQAASQGHFRTWCSAEERQREQLGEFLRQLEERSCAEKLAEANRAESLAVLVDGATAAAAAAGLRAQEASVLTEAVGGHAAATARDCEAQDGALVKVEEAAAALEPQVDATQARLLAVTARLREQQAAVVRSMRDGAAEVAARAAPATEAVTAAVEEHRIALAAAAAATATRWVELRKDQGNSLRAAEAAATATAEAATAAAEARRVEAEEGQAQADAAWRRAVEALEGDAKRTSAGLRGLPAHWRDGVAAEPLAAFRVFEDVIPGAVGKGAEQAEAPKLCTEVAARPSEEALCAEFLATASERPAGTAVLKEQPKRTPKPSPPRSSPRGPLGAAVTSGKRPVATPASGPRLALRELQPQGSCPGVPVF